MTELRKYVAQCIEDHVSYREACNDFKRVWLEEALRRNGKNQCAVAEEIGIHRNTLSRNMRALHVQIPEGKKRQRKPCLMSSL